MVRVGWGPHLRAIVCHQTRDGRNGAEFGLISPTYNTCCFAGLHITCTKLMSRCLICLRTFAPNLRLLSQCEEARQSPHCFFGLPPTDDNPIAFVNTKANFFTHPPLPEVMVVDIESPPLLAFWTLSPPAFSLVLAHHLDTESPCFFPGVSSPLLTFQTLTPPAFPLVLPHHC